MQIIQDTREQNPWWFMGDVKVQKLDCGDYTTSLLLDVLRVERKATTAEIYLNLGRKTNKERFYRELEKLKKFPHAYIVCEFPEHYLHTFPNNSGMPQSAVAQLKITAKYLRKLVHEVNEIIPIVFAGSKPDAEKYFESLVLDLEQDYVRSHNISS